MAMAGVVDTRANIHVSGGQESQSGEDAVREIRKADISLNESMAANATQEQDQFLTGKQ